MAFLRRRLTVFFCYAICVVVLPHHVYAASDYHTSPGASWIVDKERLDTLQPSADCSEVWDILWQWSKRGNLEARAKLLFLVAPPIHGNILYMPGSAENYISQLRDMAILSVHSEGFKSGNGSLDKFRSDIADMAYISASFNRMAPGKRFITCTANHRSNDCTNLAVREGLVPSFEKYANQVDLLLKEGVMYSCPKTSSN